VMSVKAVEKASARFTIGFVNIGFVTFSRD
jgi:hypothetical protein